MVAYERSAFRFSRSYKAYQEKKRFVKNVGYEVITVGFPRAALARFEGVEILESSATHVVLRAPQSFSDEEFLKWKAETPLLEPKVIRSYDRLTNLGVGVMKSKELPVFTCSYELLKYVYATSQKLKREYKYSLGIELKNELLYLLREIQQAIFSFENKLEHIRAAQLHLETSRIHLRLLHDLGQLSPRVFSHIVLQTGEISAQLAAWSKALSREFKNRRIAQEKVRVGTSTELPRVPDKISNPLTAPTEMDELLAMGLLKEKEPFQSR